MSYLPTSTVLASIKENRPIPLQARWIEWEPPHPGTTTKAQSFADKNTETIECITANGNCVGMYKMQPFLRTRIKIDGNSYLLLYLFDGWYILISTIIGNTNKPPQLTTSDKLILDTLLEQFLIQTNKGQI